jgi:3-hydroxy-9,10-secoandrosta-1,3,5(10)-triene-9,17-dione monooxygenase
MADLTHHADIDYRSKLNIVHFRPDAPAGCRSSGGNRLREENDMQLATGKTTAHADPPTADEMKARARSIVGQLAKLAPEADRLRRLPTESVVLVKSQHLGRVIQPKSCGGYALSMRAHVDVISTIGEGCGATAWVYGVAHAHSWMMGHFPKEAQREVYGSDPDMLVSAVVAPRGTAVKHADGTYVLNGFWPFASGCEHAGWLLLGTEVFDTGGTKVDEADLLVPTADIQIQDDWYVAGLQGTGSASVVAKDLRVPGHRYLSLPPWLESELPTFRAGNDEWLTRAQAIPVLGLCISTAALGIARAALAEFRRIVPGKRVVYTNHISDEWIPMQVTLGTAAAMIHAAELVIYQIADDIDEWARRGHKMPDEVRARIRMDCGHAVRMLMDAIDKLFVNGGAAGLSLSGSLQRTARDLHAINMHALLLFDTGAEIYGRALFGKSFNTPIV